MSAKKTERLVNLVICLLAAREFVTAEQIRATVGGYDKDAGDEAFGRMFERDKAELRDLGIPIKTGPAPSFYGGEGYRIDRGDYELPEIALDAEESAAIALAALVWDSPRLRASTSSALLKLKAAGVDLDVEAADPAGVGAPPAVGQQDAVGVLLDAVERQRVVTFSYRSSRAAVPITRTFEPWGVVTQRARWYVVGHDRDRGETRTFRLSRIGEVVLHGPRSVEPPAGVDLRELVGVTVAREPLAGSARVWIADGAGSGLRRRGTPVSRADVAGRAGDVVELPGASSDWLVRQILALGPDARVASPADLRNRVRGELVRLTGGSGGGT